MLAVQDLNREKHRSCLKRQHLAKSQKTEVTAENDSRQPNSKLQPNAASYLFCFDLRATKIMTESLETKFLKSSGVFVPAQAHARESTRDEGSNFLQIRMVSWDVDHARNEGLKPFIIRGNSWKTLV